MFTKYIVAGWAITAAGMGLVIWFLWSQYNDERTLRATAEANLAVSEKTLELTEKQVEIAKAEAAVLQERNDLAQLQLQERSRQLNEMRLTIQQDAYERPYRNSVDVHNWLARWMCEVHAATDGTGGVDCSASVPTGTADLPAEPPQ